MKKFFKCLSLNIICFCVSILLLNAKIFGGLMPFFLPFFFSLVISNKKWGNFLFGTTIAYLVNNFYLVGILNFFNLVIVVLFLIFVVKKRIKLNMLFLIGAIIFTHIADFLLFSGTKVDFLLLLATIVLEIVLSYFYSKFTIALFERSLYKFVIDEALGFCLFVMPLFMLIYNLRFLNFYIGKGIVFGVFVAVCGFLNPLECVFFAFSVGLGISIFNTNIVCLAVCLIWMVSFVSFFKFNKFLALFAGLVADFLTWLCFNCDYNYSYLDFLPLIVCGIIGLVLSNASFGGIKEKLRTPLLSLTQNEIFCLEEGDLKYKLNSLSKLFYSMYSVYNNMVIGGISNTQIEKSLIREIERYHCRGCVKYQQCYSTKKLATKAIENLIKCGVSKRKVSVLDAPDFLTANCGKTSKMIDSINLSLENIGKYEKELKKEDETKLCLSQQFLGISDVIDNYKLKSGLGERAERRIEKKIIEYFLFNNILIGDVALFFKEGVFNEAILLLKNDGYKSEQVLEVLQSYFKLPLKIKTNNFIKMSGWQVVVFEKKEKYNYIYGIAQLKKEELSGDKYSKLDLHNGKVMFTLCDGKGTGSVANNLSNMTISLIESFYRVGFDSELISFNVNSILSYKSGENFSAVDICVLDLNSGELNIIKRGGTPSVIKKTKESLLIEGKDLPFGVIENSKCSVINNFIENGDIVVLSSDGVFDAFNNTEEYVGFVNNLKCGNMKLFAQQILKRAYELNKNRVLDDMTVLVFKIVRS